LGTKPSDHYDQTNVTAALMAGDLFAFVYAPLINPINEVVSAHIIIIRLLVRLDPFFAAQKR
jgi:hypothetical protein